MTILSIGSLSLSVSNCADNGTGSIRVTSTTLHGLTTGQGLFISSVIGTTEANASWQSITVIDTTNFDLDGSTFSNAYISGGDISRDYPTIALWWAGSPGDLVTATDTWEGECYNDTEFTVTAGIALSGVTTNATYFASLSAASGEGIRDNVNKLTNALRYNVSNGVGIRKTNNYGTVITVTCDFFTIDGIQVKAASLSRAIGFTSVTSTHANSVKNCIAHVELGTGSALLFNARFNNLAVNNVVIVESGATVDGFSFSAFGAAGCVCNNTIITLDGASTALGVDITGGSPDLVAKNNAIFGFADALDTGITWATGTDYNATDNATLPAGSNNQTSLTFADQFENVAGISTLDLRNKTTADLVGAGIRDAANTNDLDILGQSRVTTATGQTVGATEFVAAGGVTINATLGTVSITGFDTTVTSTTLINSTFGAINIAGFNATVSTGVDISATLGEINITGYNATVDLGGTTITATLGEVSIAGFNPGISAGTDITATLGTVSIQGFNATVSQPTDITATLGIIDIAGYNPVISATTTIPATLGLISITGFDTIVTNPKPGAPPSNKRILYINATKRTIDIKKTKRTITIS